MLTLKKQNEDAMILFYCRKTEQSNYQRISRNHSTTAFRLHNDRLGGYRFDAELDCAIAMT